jgi:hypothetical protein
MPHRPRTAALAVTAFAAFLATVVQTHPLDASQGDQAVALTRDPVVARIFEHIAGAPRPLVLVVDSRQFPRAVWTRVKDLVAFRLHRPAAEGTTIADAATYLVRGSKVYSKALAALRGEATSKEYVWCLLAAVLAHEAAHTEPLTDRQALTAEAEQRNPVEHY